MLSSDAENTAVHDFATQAEKDSLSKKLAETFDWLHDNAEKADEATLRQKRADLLYVSKTASSNTGTCGDGEADLRKRSDLEQPIIFRFNERQARGKAVDDFQQAMFSARAFYTEATKNNTAAIEAQELATPENPVAPPKFTDEELKSVADLMKENEVWMDSLMETQVKLDLEDDKTKDPVIFTKDLNEKGKALQMTVCPIRCAKCGPKV